MNDVFASLFEWFGLSPLYSKDMGDFLRGWDITCSGYIGRQWYVFIGWLMLLIAIFTYSLQYHIIDRPRLNRARHWWFFALAPVILNFFIAFTIPFNAYEAGDYCKSLKLSVLDCIGFGISCAIWTLVVLMIISVISPFRRLSTNCRHTTFWKP